MDKLKTKTVDAEGLTLEEKFAKGMVQLQNIRPFYQAIYSNMPKIESSSCPTMGVTSKEIVYDREFVMKLPFSEFLFVSLHEVAHVALLHNARRRGRDSLLWNIACDLVVNAGLAKEFGLSPGAEKATQTSKIKMPANIVFSPKTDVDTDCTEELYEELANQAKKNNYFNFVQNGAGKGQPQPAGGSGGGNGGESGDGEAGSGSNPGKGGQGQGNQSTSGAKTPTAGESSAKADTKDRDPRYPKFESGQFAFDIQGHKFKVDVNKYSGDLVDSGDTDNAQLEQARRIIHDATTRSKLWGDSPGWMGRLVDQIMAPEVNWKSVLKKYVVFHTSKDSSFRTPDKRMTYQDAIYPGSTSNDDMLLKDFKINIDTSGSMSDEDLGEALGHVKNLCKQYKVKAELLFWDAAVESKCSIDSFEQALKSRPAGGGGTDPSCVFEYCASKKCKVKPAFHLFITDGYFATEQLAKYKVKNKNTIWLIIGGNADFKPPFGVVAKYKSSKKS